MSDNRLGRGGNWLIWIAALVIPAIILLIGRSSHPQRNKSKPNVSLETVEIKSKGNLVPLPHSHLAKQSTPQEKTESLTQPHGPRSQYG